MSHVTDMKVRIMSLEALKKAGAMLGMELVKQSTYRWYGTHVGDYPLPKGFKKQDMGRNCDYVLRLKNNSTAYEVGVYKARDGKPGYVMLWDFWAGGHGLQKAIGKDGEKLKTSYAEQLAKEKMSSLQRQGFRMQRTVDKDGTIHVRAVR